MNPQSYPGTSPDLTDGGSGAIAALRRHRSAAPSGLSRFASQAKPAATIAGALVDVRGLLATACGFLIFFIVYGVFA